MDWFSKLRAWNTAEEKIKTGEEDRESDIKHLLVDLTNEDMDALLKLKEIEEEDAVAYVSSLKSIFTSNDMELKLRVEAAKFMKKILSVAWKKLSDSMKASFKQDLVTLIGSSKDESMITSAVMMLTMLAFNEFGDEEFCQMIKCLTTQLKYLPYDAMIVILRSIDSNTLCTGDSIEKKEAILTIVIDCMTINEAAVVHLYGFEALRMILQATYAQLKKYLPCIISFTSKAKDEAKDEETLPSKILEYWLLMAEHELERYTSNSCMYYLEQATKVLLGQGILMKQSKMKQLTDKITEIQKKSSLTQVVKGDLTF